MTSHINNILKQALTTFTCKPDLFYSNLNLLISLLDKLTAEDVNLHPRFSSEELWIKPGKAPVSCIDIFENPYVTMGIFIIKPGGQLPLHNHPEMHGLIKVIKGKVKITSYSLNTEKTLEVDSRTSKGDITALKHYTHRKIVTAELSSCEIVDTNSKTCVLEPNKKNLHEIHSVDGPAAFLDILAPPYGTLTSNNGPRLCSYYSVLSQISPTVFKLQEMRSPSWYWTDAFQYTGPALTL